MKQIVLLGGKAELLEVPVPAAPAAGVLVRTVCSVISSGTERASLHSTGESLLDKARRKPELVTQVLQSIQKDGLSTTFDRVRNRLREPVATGYSCAGIITAVGNRIKDLRVGQAVSCGGARYANHAQYVAVPRNLCVPVPEGLSLEDAASATIGAIALQGIRQAHLELGQVVAVVGLGLIGLLEVQLARAAGARVVAVDPLASRRELASSLGAAYSCAPEDLENLVAELTAQLGVDATLIAAATPSAEPLQSAMRTTRKRGVVVIVGDVGLSFSRSPFYEKEIELRIACSMGPGRYDPAYEEAGIDYPAPFVRWTEQRNMAAYLELLRAGQVQWRPLVTHELGLEEAEAAFQLLESDPGALAISLRYATTEPSREVPARTMAPARPVAKSGVVRLAVIGAGAFARSVHFPLLRRMSDRFTITGVATRSGLNSAVAAREVGSSSSTSDYRELLAREDVEAVLIATRHDQHARLAKEALEAGKAVFLEKPLALEPVELESLLDTVASAGLPFMVGFNRRFSRATRLLRERLAVHAAPAVVHYRVNAAPGGAADWSHGEEGGGRAVGEACHMLDFFHALFEEPLAELQTLARGGDPEANFSVQLRFRDGSLCELLYTTCGHPGLPKERVEAFLGSEVVLIDDFRSVELVKTGVLRRRRFRVDKGYRDEWAAFHAACTGAPRLPIPVEQLRSVALATFAIRDSTRG